MHRCIIRSSQSQTDVDVLIDTQTQSDTLTLFRNIVRHTVRSIVRAMTCVQPSELSRASEAYSVDLRAVSTQKCQQLVATEGQIQSHQGMERGLSRTWENFLVPDTRTRSSRDLHIHSWWSRKRQHKVLLRPATPGPQLLWTHPRVSQHPVPIQLQWSPQLALDPCQSCHCPGG